MARPDDTVASPEPAQIVIDRASLGVDLCEAWALSMAETELADLGLAKSFPNARQASRVPGTVPPLEYWEHQATMTAHRIVRAQIACMSDTSTMPRQTPTTHAFFSDRNIEIRRRYRWGR